MSESAYEIASRQFREAQEREKVRRREEEGMLCLTRYTCRSEEAATVRLRIGRDELLKLAEAGDCEIVVKLLECDHARARIGFLAPPEVAVARDDMKQA